MSLKLSDAAMRLKGQPMFKLLANIQQMEREGKDIIHFEIGDPDFQTPPNIVEAAYTAMRNGKTHYTDAMGVYEFRQAIAGYIYRYRGFRPDIEQVIVTPSTNISIYFAIQCIVNPGEEVIVPDPGFPSYDAAISLCGATRICVHLKEKNKFCLMADDVEALLTDRTRLVIVNSPHNPTGAVMNKKELEKIARLCIERNIYLYSDETYARMIYGEEEFYTPSLLDGCKTNIILAASFSKAYAMTGWRLGFCIAPTSICEKMGLMIQTTTSCVSGFLQYGGMEALQGPQDSVEEMINMYKKRRDILVDGLNQIHGVRCLVPPGSFYVYPSIVGTGLTSKEFADKALNEGYVGLLPGTDFGVSGEGYVRLCYANSEKNIIEGIKRLKKVFHQ